MKLKYEKNEQVAISSLYGILSSNITIPEGFTLKSFVDSAGTTYQVDGSDTITISADTYLNLSCDREIVPLCFRSLQNGSTVSIAKVNNAPDLDLKYSTDNTVWRDYTGTQLTIDNGEIVYFRAGPLGNETFSFDSSNYNYFSMTGRFCRRRRHNEPA